AYRIVLMEPNHRYRAEKQVYDRIDRIGTRLQVSNDHFLVLFLLADILQILSNPMTATISNLEGIAHVITRMDWYCALTRHLLIKDNVVTGDESLNSVLQQLEQRVVALYKAILLYHMKSVYFYYRH